MDIVRTYQAGSRVICGACATQEPLALLVERPAVGGVAIRCDACHRPIEPERPAASGATAGARPGLRVAA